MIINIPSFDSSVIASQFVKYGTRPWDATSVTGYVRPADTYYQDQGFLIYKNITDNNGVFEIGFSGFEWFQATENAFIMRFIDPNHFISIKLDPSNTAGTPNAQGLLIARNNTVKLAGDWVPLVYDIAAIGESLPTTGKYRITVTNNRDYKIDILNGSGKLICTGYYTDTDPNANVPGKIGFFHTIAYDARMNPGWSSMKFNATVVQTPPTITYFTSTKNIITVGQSATLGWGVTSGTATTTVKLLSSGAILSLTGTSAVSPVTTQIYTLSAFNSVGATSAAVRLEVSPHMSVINSFSADKMLVPPGDVSPVVSWSVSYTKRVVVAFGATILTDKTFTDAQANSVSAQIGTVAGRAGTFGISAYGLDITVPVTSSLTITEVPNPIIDFFTNDGPTCPNVPIKLSWSSKFCTGASIDHSIGSVSATGNVTISATNTTAYKLTVWNSLGISASTQSLVDLFKNPPIVLLTVRRANGSIVPDGSTIDVSTVAGVELTLDAFGSHDDDGQIVHYKYYANNVLIGWGDGLTSTKHIIKDGTVTYKVEGTDPCGFVGTKTYTVKAEEKLPPVAIISNANIVIQAPRDMYLDGSQSTAPDSYIIAWEWYYGVGSDPTTLFSTSGEYVTFPITYSGVYKFKLRIRNGFGVWAESNIVIANYLSGGKVLDPEAGPDVVMCVDVGDNAVVVLDGSQSKEPASTTVTYKWTLYDGYTKIFESYQKVCTVELGAGAYIGSYKAVLTATCSNGLVESDSKIISVGERPSIHTTAKFNNVAITSDVVTIECPDKEGVLELKANDLPVGYTVTWKMRNNRATAKTYTIGTGEVLSYTTGAFSIPKMFWSEITTDFGCKYDSDRIILLVKNRADSMRISMVIDPPVVNMGIDGYITAKLTYDIVGATNAWLIYDNIPHVLSAMSDVQVPIVITNATLETISISATAGVCSKLKTITVAVNKNAKACAYREKYINTLVTTDVYRYGVDKKIQLLPYVPAYLRGSDIATIVTDVFEKYLNEMYFGEGCERSYPLVETPIEVVEDPDNATVVSNEYASLSDNHTPADDVAIITRGDHCVPNTEPPKISVLEKVDRLKDLVDPWKIPISKIHEYAYNLGYEVGLNRDDIRQSVAGGSDDSEVAANKYLRYMADQLPEWYKIKGTLFSIKLMLYSFGINGDVVYFYTKNYSPDENSHDGIVDSDNTIHISTGVDTEKEIVALICKNLNGDSLMTEEEQLEDNIGGLADWITTGWVANFTADLSNIPDNYIPTPHFRVWFDIQTSDGIMGSNVKKQESVAKAIMSVKPINTVFAGISGRYSAGIVTAKVKGYMNVRKVVNVNVGIPNQICDYWK